MKKMATIKTKDGLELKASNYIFININLSMVRKEIADAIAFVQNDGHISEYIESPKVGGVEMLFKHQITNWDEL